MIDNISKNEIYKASIMYPHLYPWRKQLKNFKNGEINEVLKNIGVDTEEKRRKVGWALDLLIYEKALEVKDNKELIDKVLEAFLHLKMECELPPSNLIYSLAQRKDLIYKEDLQLYNNFIGHGKTNFDNNKNIEKQKIWLQDLNMYKFIIMKGEHDLTRESLAEYIYKNTIDCFKFSEDEKLLIEKRVSLLGFGGRRNILFYRESQKHGELVIDQLLKNFVVKEKKEDLFLDDLLEMVDEIAIKEEVIKEESIKEEVIKENKYEEESLSKELFLKNVEKSLDELLLKQDENDNHRELLKKLVNPSEGAVLSQLYDLYMRFNEFDRDNIYAILTDFFNYLMIQGLNTVENQYEIGKKISAKSNELLNRYRTIVPVERDEFLAQVIYPAWEYKGEQIMQPVIKPV